MPNIIGRIFNQYNTITSSKDNSSFGELSSQYTINEGALFAGDFMGRYSTQENLTGTTPLYAESINLDASKSNSIYGATSTV